MGWQCTLYIWALPEMKPKTVSELNLCSLCLTCRKLLCHWHACTIPCDPINAPLFIYFYFSSRDLYLGPLEALLCSRLRLDVLLVPVVFVCRCCPHVLCTVNKLQSGCCSAANEAGDNSHPDDVLQLLCRQWDNDYTHFFDAHCVFFDLRLILYWRHKEKETQKSSPKKNTRIHV